MRLLPKRNLQTISTLFILSAISGCKSQDRQVVSIFHAASLSGALSTLEEQLESTHPDLDIRLEPSGSQVAARKVAELNRRADLVMAADWKIIDEILVPRHADYILLFASNEIVLAHAEHSRHTEEITSDNWYKVLLRPHVRLGMADENLAPIGYQTLQAWELAEIFYGTEKTEPDLAARLKNQCRPEHITPDIAELVSLLEARVLDYAFVFRSMAEEHNLKITPLPAECNLSKPALKEQYAKVHVKVKMKTTQGLIDLKAEPILYGLTIPNTAQNSQGAKKVVTFLLGTDGTRILSRFGFHPLVPVRAGGKTPLPSWLLPNNIRKEPT